MPTLSLLRCLSAPLATFLLVVAGSSSAEPARRVVSLNPSLTAIVLALGAGDVLVGVDDFSARQREQVAHLPKVGGLFNPSLEAVIALRPDLVVLVPSVEQRDFAARLQALSVPVSSFENLRFDQVLENIQRLGRLTGREEAAERRIRSIRQARAAAERAAPEGERPRVVLVVQREPIFVAGGGSFIDEMLGAVGANNAAASFEGAYPRVSAEWLVAAAPEVLLDASPRVGDASAFWSRWPSLPAVSAGRVRGLAPFVTLPGPDLDRALEALTRAVHGPGAGPDLAEARASSGS